MKYLKSFLFVSAFALTVSSCKKDKDDTVPPPAGPKKNIVFIYKSDATGGQAFKALLDSNNCNVTLLDRPAAAAFNYSPFDLIVVGSNTDTQNPTDWSTAEASAIRDSGKPVLLLGIGGLQLAEKMNNTVHYGACAGNSLASFTVTNAADAIYKSPKAIPAVAGQPLAIFSSASNVQVYVQIGGVIASNVTTIGSVASGSTDYPVSLESDRFGVFGYTKNVDQMTNTGRDFIVNLVYRVGKF